MQVLSDKQQTMTVLRISIWVPKDVHCCSNRLHKEPLSYEARKSIKKLKTDDIILNADNVVKLIDDFRLAVKHTGSFDFDDPGAPDNETHKQLLDLIKVHYLIVLTMFLGLSILNFRSF